MGLVASENRVPIQDILIIEELVVLTLERMGLIGIPRVPYIGLLLLFLIVLIY
jgi:hypothetical protein